MTKVCEVCKHKIRGNDFVDLSKLNNPLLYGYWCRSCFLAMLYGEIDDMKIKVNTLLAYLEHITVNKKGGDVDDGVKVNSKVNL